MMITKPLGLYVHVPFCVRKCNYCDFCSFPIENINCREEYIDELCREIFSYKKKNISIDSIFFGGGTPSLLTEEEFERITFAIKDSFDVLADCEFTLEANPKTLDKKKLDKYISCGVNRISIGLQSIHENEQKILGRIHDFDDFLESFHLARDSGINNINVDLMYGIPEQTSESFKKTLESVVSLSPEHISLYSLILEEGTPFFDNAESLALPDEDSDCDMYYIAAGYLRDKHYKHYEISNYAKPGFECRHNLKYWRDEEFIGVGVSAYSYFCGSRYGNSRKLDEYLSESKTNYVVSERIDDTSREFEYVMLRLRLAEGLSLADYEAKFGKDFYIGRERKIDELCMAGLLVVSDGRIMLTERGFYVSKFILTELL